ncbi:hypothetical protein JoomaDRAFT_1390 [Galbibacter orientalis DSM 19592]|uniref:Lipoprotein n=1 Tax=Galbibacter orientalis DSM 19592 TaxID=926559 RepID=I3C462_9FLAO|nr:hypothetical protein [Galbibacter orientalis]EIJ38405.1 hypothetical protein JoomaDRAFT_1390 [Galbibacter orientalis DSM 19592]|tara:strand:- start:39 stop:491 length:453 start_codon:yes stop_codon:yes gene_type:complete
MKKFFVLMLCTFTLLSFSSCDLSDDDATNFYYETMEITSANFPEYFEYGKVYPIDFTYLRPTDCHIYNGFEFNHTGETERTIFAVATVLDRTDCETLTDTEGTDSFDFEVRYRNTYTFKFYIGEDDNGEKQYLTYEVPVREVGEETTTSM